MDEKKLYRVRPGGHCGSKHAATGIVLMEGEEHLLDPAIAGREIFEEVKSKKGLGARENTSGGSEEVR